MTNNKKNPIGWIKQYPAKALITIFIIVIPVIFLTVFAVNNFSNKNRFFFDTTESGSPIYLKKKDLSNKDKLNNYLTIDINLDKIEIPVETLDEETGEITYSKGKYIFDVSYEPNVEHTNSNFTFNWMLNMGKKELNTEAQSVALTNKSRTHVINYNYPPYFEKFIFIKSKRPKLPYLYFKITVTPEAIIGFPQKDINIYYQIDLNQFKPGVTQAT